MARKYILLMETEGYLTGTDKAALQSELENYGLYNISFDGTTLSEVGYGEEITLHIKGKYDNNVLSFADGISKYTGEARDIDIETSSTAKQ